MEMVVDLFCGGGGASEGIRRALGRAPTIAVNHDPAAILMHAANHPDTIHFERSVFEVSPRSVGERVDLLWASPDCTHFSRAKGGKPRRKEIRDLAWVVVEWAQAVRPRVIALENVPEFLTWGPLHDCGREGCPSHPECLDTCGQPVKEQAGETFETFVTRLRLLGYRVDWRVLCAADYGAPTSRRRLFLVARCDGEAPAWPEPTHGPGRALPWRTAAECIDWSIPCPSIFERERPLAEATQRRIVEGIHRYVLNAPRPFLVHLTLGEQATLIQTGYGERKSQAPRVLDLGAPLGTVVAGGNKHALLTAFLAKHYSGVVGQDLARPIGTVTAIDHHSLVAVHLIHHRGQSVGREVDAPAPTVTAGGQGHLGLVAAFLTKFYGQGSQAQGVNVPLDTIVSKDRFGLVTVTLDGEPHVLADIGLRMLQPRELARAQGFQDSYVLTGSKAQQVARIGNSVPPDVVAAVVRAQSPRRARRAA